MSAVMHVHPLRESATKGRILLIDDSWFIRRLFSFIFEDLGYLIETAENAREGIRMATEVPYDVIVVDGVLPDMDGQDVCRHIADLPREKPILIMCTGSNLIYQDRHSMCRDGVDACMKKDKDGQLLVAHVERLLAIRDSRRLPPVA